MEKFTTSTPKVLYEGKRFRVVHGWDRDFVERKCTGVAVIIAITHENELLLVEQFRPAVRQQVIELPAGLVGDEPGKENETLEEAAKRELLEETGFQAKSIERWIQGPISPGLSSEIITFFYTDDVIKMGPGGGVDSEDITVHRVPLLQIPSYLENIRQRGVLIDLKLFLGLCYLQQIS